MSGKFQHFQDHLTSRYKVPHQIPHKQIQGHLTSKIKMSNQHFQDISPNRMSHITSNLLGKSKVSTQMKPSKSSGQATLNSPFSFTTLTPCSPSHLRFTLIPSKCSNSIDFSNTSAAIHLKAASAAEPNHYQPSTLPNVPPDDNPYVPHNAHLQLQPP